MLAQGPAVRFRGLVNWALVSGLDRGIAPGADAVGAGVAVLGHLVDAQEVLARVQVAELLHLRQVHPTKQASST
jgi:hypothetical protein